MTVIRMVKQVRAGFFYNGAKPRLRRFFTATAAGGATWVCIAGEFASV